jgi:hypothetical protein
MGLPQLRDVTVFFRADLMIALADHIYRSDPLTIARLCDNPSAIGIVGEILTPSQGRRP